MRFRRQVQNRIRLKGIKGFRNRICIGNVDLQMPVTVRIDIRDGCRIAGIGALIDIEYGCVRQSVEVTYDCRADKSESACHQNFH